MFLAENNPDRYRYSVTWSDEDGEFLAQCAEFPSLSHLDTSRSAAIEGIAALVQAVVADLSARGEPIPAPRRQAA